MDTEEQSVQRVHSQGETKSQCSRSRVYFNRFWKYCEAYGAIFAYYGSVIGGLGSAIAIPIINE